MYAQRRDHPVERRTNPGRLNQPVVQPVRVSGTAHQASSREPASRTAPGVVRNAGPKHPAERYVDLGPVARVGSAGGQERPGRGERDGSLGQEDVLPA